MVNQKQDISLFVQTSIFPKKKSLKSRNSKDHFFYAFENENLKDERAVEEKNSVRKGQEETENNKKTENNFLEFGELSGSLSFLKSNESLEENEDPLPDTAGIVSKILFTSSKQEGLVRKKTKEFLMKQMSVQSSKSLKSTKSLKSIPELKEIAEKSSDNLGEETVRNKRQAFKRQKTGVVLGV